MTSKNNNSKMDNDLESDINTYQMGKFNLVKSEINICEKNFIGFEDSDYDLVNSINSSSSDINFISKSNSVFNSKLFIGTNFDSKTPVNKINNLINTNTTSTVLNVFGNSNLNGDLYTDQLFIKNNCFTNKSIILNGVLVLQDEQFINILSQYDFDSNLIHISTYKTLLSNILISVKNINIIEQKKSSSISFISITDENIFSQDILSIRKKFIFNDIDEEIYTFLLVFVVKFNNKIISVKPIMDTFVISDLKGNIFSISS